MTEAKYEVSGEVTSYCTKCKTERLHIIVALEKSIPKRVQCKACQGEHNYRPLKLKKGSDKTKKDASSNEEAAKTPKKSPAKKKAAAPKKSAAQKKFEEKLANEKERREQLLAEWTEAKEKLGDEPARQYMMDDMYQVGEAIGHGKFGTGFVREIIDTNKMMVLFELGLKRMAQNRP